MVECEASTFPLVNLTKVSTAAHSTQCLIILTFKLLPLKEGDILAPFFL